MSRLADMTGRRFTRLVVTARAGSTPAGQATWSCLCDCGAEVVVAGQALRDGLTTSCGCRKAEVARARSRTHGMTGTPEYHAWANMIRRCEHPEPKDLGCYGGRGIKVCTRWRASFAAFLADVGHRPASGLSIDRIDVNGDYEPGNVRWADAVTQANNKRNNVVVDIAGETMRLIDVIPTNAAGVRRGLIYERLKRGWPAEAAITTPVLHPTGKRAAGSRHWQG